MISRAASLLIVIAVWAALYLPLLGSSELRGEEGKRVLPAVQMLDSGNYLVPYLGARPYLSKPPLLNWIVAISFRIFGIRNEWSARFPSTMLVLVVALVLVIAGRINLGPIGATIAAVCWLTTLELVDKGRTVEIDAINASLSGLALFLWLTFWRQNRSSWLTFIVPWIFLGLGLLAKGPGLLLFFYSVLVAVLWRHGRLRELLQPAHWTGVVMILAIFAAWAIPFFLAVRSQSLGQAWWHEAAAVLHGEIGRSENWVLNFPRGIAFFLPWILLLPFVRFNKIENTVERETARGLALGMVVPFVGVLLLPGALPRYVLPLVAPLSWLVGIVVANDAFEWQPKIKHFQIRLSCQIARWAVAIALAAEIVIFPVRAAILFNKHEVHRPVAAQINAAIPIDQRLYAVDPSFQPYLFYVRAPVIYLQSLEGLPANARFFLIQSRELAKMEMSARWSQLRPRFLVRTPLFRNRGTMLFSVTANQSSQ
jgi:4-amino-4-deoxy-L-arabinose transferase-like glycosyltransferase